MRKKYKHARITYDSKEKDQDIFIEKYFGEKKILDLARIERLLNEYSKQSEELKEQIKRNDSLTTRISNLRKELEVSKSRESDNEAIKRVCEIIEDRIDFVTGEPIMSRVAEHFTRVKEELEREGLWRI